MNIFIFLVLYAFPPLTFLIGLIGLWKDPSHWKRYLPMCVYFLFIGAYTLIPDPVMGTDLLRYLPKIDFFGTLSFEDALSYEGKFSFAPALLFWFFGKLDMAHMVPALTTAVVYAVAGYITCDTAERYDGKRFIIYVFLLQLILLPYPFIINNVRNVFAFSLVVLAAYLDIIKGKRNLFVWFLYFLGPLMHLSAVALPLFRIASSFSKKYFELFLLCQFFFTAIVFEVYKYTSLLTFSGRLGYAALSVIKKLNGYLLNTTNIGAVRYMQSSWFSSRTFVVMSVVFVLIFLWYAIRTNNQWLHDDKKLYSFLAMIATLAISFHVYMLVPNYWRFAAALDVAIGIMYIPLLCRFRHISTIPKICLYGSLSIIPFLIVFRCIDLWRAFYYSTWLFDFLTTNYITIIFDLVRGINV